LAKNLSATTLKLLNSSKKTNQWTVVSIHKAFGEVYLSATCGIKTQFPFHDPPS
jgi:hypothetical protein